jgi:hypothetical protein
MSSVFCEMDINKIMLFCKYFSHAFFEVYVHAKITILYLMLKPRAQKLEI